MLTSFEELCIMRAVAENCFARVLNPHWGAYILSSTDRLFRSIRTLHIYIYIYILHCCTAGAKMLPIFRPVFWLLLVKNYLLRQNELAYLTRRLKSSFYQKEAKRMVTLVLLNLNLFKESCSSNFWFHFDFSTIKVLNTIREVLIFFYIKIIYRSI